MLASGAQMRACCSALIADRSVWKVASTKMRGFLELDVAQELEMVRLYFYSRLYHNLHHFNLVLQNAAA